MGNCVSISPHNKNSDSKLATQIGSTPSQENTDKSQQQTAGENGFLPPQSPMRHVAGFQGFNSKDEVFFDSQPWLDSDCEDYFSVNGDTPSRGNTPIHPQSFSQATPIHPKSDQATAQIDKVSNTENTLDSETKSPPMDMKKQLIELFSESFSKADADGDQNSHHQQKGISSDFNNIPPKSASRSPNTIRSSETTPYGDYYYRKEKSAQNAQGCIPSLRRSLSFSERRKRTSLAKTGGWILKTRISAIKMVHLFFCWRRLLALPSPRSHTNCNNRKELIFHFIKSSKISISPIIINHRSAANPPESNYESQTYANMEPKVFSIFSIFCCSVLLICIANTR